MFNNSNGNNSLSGAMLGVALSNAMNDQVFRNVLGYALLQNEKKLDDGIGMALLMNNSTPVVPTYTSTIKIKRR